ncbi:hypothetical protein EG329_010471 [Mollisiaceae sp. DMI_Dod_QoI]|nr:hypothetical protein EG329_010471 [Helotiales sp. DMI_Dod_QoI]
MSGKPIVYDFSPFLTAPAVQRVAAPYGAPQIINIPETRIPSPLAPNLAPQTIKDLKEYLTGTGPDGTGPKDGVEVWETWKRAWDLWNNHYIEGRECPTWIKSEYERIKKVMEDEKKNKKKKRKDPSLASAGGGGGNGGGNGNNGTDVYRRVFAASAPRPDIGKKWIIHPYRTKKIQVPSGKKIQRNNPNPVPKYTTKHRIAKKMVNQKAGETVKIYRKEPKFEEFEEMRVVRENGLWKPLTPWKDIVKLRARGKLQTPSESENTPEPGLEPLGTLIEKARVRRINQHLEETDISDEEKPFPLMPYEDLVALRAVGDAIPVKGRDSESKYVKSRPPLWQPNSYDLIDTGEVETLTEGRDRVEVLGIESYTETTYIEPFEEVDEMMDMSVPQWLEINDPAYKPPAMPKPQTPPVSPFKHTTRNTPPTDALDFLIMGTKDHARYQEWFDNLPNRWNIVNPTNLASATNASWLEYQSDMKDKVKRMWVHIGTMGNFQSATHTNRPVLDNYTLNPPKAVAEDGESDEDMADASELEYEDAYEDEEMDDNYEQRALGEDEEDYQDESDMKPMSEQSDDYWNESDGDMGSDESNKDPAGENGGGDGTGFDGGGIGPPPRGPDGAAGGFLPMKLFPEYQEPEEDENGDYPDWTNELQNTVWRPRRVGEKTLKVDLDEPWGQITDLEVDGGIDCGRSPYPVLRPVNKYIKNVTSDGIGDGVSYRKEKIWDGVTSTIFNMPIRPDEAGPETLDEREQRIKLVYGDIHLDEPSRHEFFPLDIRRVRQVDPTTGEPFEPKKERTLSEGEIEIDFDLPWCSPAIRYVVMKDTDAWWVTPEQEKLRDVPPRRYPQPDGAREGDKYLPLDDSYWQEELNNDEELKARYFVTNLHGGTLLVNGVEIKKGCIAGPLPDFAVIQTPGGQVSFWWGVGGRNWGQGEDSPTLAANWRQLRRMPGWEKVGLNAGQVWNRIIRDRLQREESGNDEEDDDQWDLWKNPPPPEKHDNNSGGNCGGGRGGSGDNNAIPAATVHSPVEMGTSFDIGPPCSLNAFKPPDLFKTEEVELQWLHTRAAPLRETVLGLANASKKQVDELRVLSKLIEPISDAFWPGPNQPARPEIVAQRLEDAKWRVKEPEVFANQQALLYRHRIRRENEEKAKAAVYKAANKENTKKRQAEHQARQEETKRTRLRLEQQIRDAEANMIQTQQNIKQKEENKAKKEEYKKSVLEEAIKLDTIIRNEAQLNNIIDATEAGKRRTAQRRAEIAQETLKLARVNSARANEGLQAVPPRLQLSDAKYQELLRDAVNYLNPKREEIEKAAAKKKREEKEKEIREIIRVRAIKEAAERKAEREKKAAEEAKNAPKTQAEIDQQERRLRFEAAQARSDAQKFKEAEDKRKAEEAKRAKEEAARRTPIRRLAKEEQVSPIKAPIFISTPGLSPLSPVSPVSPNTLIKAPVSSTTSPASPKKILDIKNAKEAAEALKNAEAKAYETLDQLAAAANQSVAEYLAVTGTSKEDWLKRWKLADNITQPFVRVSGSPIPPDPGSTPGDKPPDSSSGEGSSPPGLKLDPGPPEYNGVLSSIAENQLLAARAAMRDAVRTGIQARVTASKGKLQPYQIAQQAGWVDVQAMVNHYMRSVTEDDIQATVKPLIVDPVLALSAAQLEAIRVAKLKDPKIDPGKISAVDPVKVMRDATIKAKRADEQTKDNRYVALAQKIMNMASWDIITANLATQKPIPLPSGGGAL